jgi:TolB-like protein/DNA-binding winged helix-turn-helix (wHTH) protein/Tfp pilus assembly protein PilF
MTAPADPLPSIYRFADLTLDVARRRVTRDGQSIDLRALDFDLLRLLVESAPNIVNSDVLAEKVWSRHFVSPENVAQRVMLLRQSLSDDANRPRYIETIRNKGYRLVPVVERVQAHAVARLRRRPAAAAAALTLATVVAAAVAYWLVGTADPPQALPSSVAVLPFENLSPDPADAFFAAGMQDEIVSQLTKIKGLRVFPVRAAVAVQNAAGDVSRDLNVATTLSGSVYYSEGRVRVNTHLRRAANHESVWSESYERERGDIFAMQSEIALDVAQALRLELTAADRRRVQRQPTADPRARDLYLVARARRPLSPEVLLAIDEVEQALAFDAAFKEAWLLDAHVRNFAQFVDPQRADEHRLRAEQAARRAVELDPEFGQAHAALGWTLLTKKDWTGAEAAFQTALGLNVPIAEMGAYGSLQLDTGKFDALASGIYEEARAADPQNELFHRMLAFVHEARGEWARASAVYESALRLFRNDERATFNLLNQRMHWLVGRDQVAEARTIQIDDDLNAGMLASLDAPQRALAALREALAAEGSPVRRRDIGLWAGHFGDPQLALDAMRSAIEEQGGQVVYVWLPQLAAMRRLPGFAAYMHDIGMVEYWQRHGWPANCRPHGGARGVECE